MVLCIFYSPYTNIDLTFSIEKLLIYFIFYIYLTEITSINQKEINIDQLNWSQNRDVAID